MASRGIKMGGGLVLNVLWAQAMAQSGCTIPVPKLRKGIGVRDKSSFILRKRFQKSKALKP